MITGHVRLNCEIKACTNSNRWRIDTPAHCISDQNNLDCRQGILQRKFSCQHNLHLKTQVFDFHIIHFLKSRAHRGGMYLGELRFSNIVRIPFAFETIKFLLNNSCKTKHSALLFQLIIWVVFTWFHHSCKKIDNETTQLRLRHDHQVLSVDWGETIHICVLYLLQTRQCLLFENSTKEQLKHNFSYHNQLQSGVV